MKAVRLLLCLMITTSGYAAETSSRNKPRGGLSAEAAGYTTRDASALSMMGWGVALAAGIATLCALIDHDAAGSSSSTSH